MSFTDVFKSGFLERTENISGLDATIALTMAVILGYFIMHVYKKTFTGVMFSKSFSVSLLALSVITTCILLAVTSNVVLSLGMVGALSFVRFRTALKEPLDVCFVFWSICIGILLGAGMIPLAIGGSIVIGIVLVLNVNRKIHEKPYILILRLTDDTAEQLAISSIAKTIERSIVKSKTISKEDGIELTMEVMLGNETTQFVNEVCRVEGVCNATLVSYNGEYMS